MRFKPGPGSGEFWVVPKEATYTCVYVYELFKQALPHFPHLFQLNFEDFTICQYDLIAFKNFPTPPKC